MAKYLVETYYTCTFKVNHYLDDINETELKNLEKRDDGKFEVLDVKLDNRKTKNLDPNNNKTLDIIFDGDVKSYYAGSEMFAEKAEYSNSKNILVVTGNVKVKDINIK